MVNATIQMLEKDYLPKIYCFFSNADYCLNFSTIISLIDEVHEPSIVESFLIKTRTRLVPACAIRDMLQNRVH